MTSYVGIVDLDCYAAVTQLISDECRKRRHVDAVGVHGATRNFQHNLFRATWRKRQRNEHQVVHTTTAAPHNSTRNQFTKHAQPNKHRRTMTSSLSPTDASSSPVTAVASTSSSSSASWCLGERRQGDVQCCGR